MRHFGIALIGVAAFLAFTASASAARLEPVGTYANPVFVTSEPGNASRLYVVEQEGRIRLTTPSGTSTFADLRSVVQSGGEQGLLSMAFAPDYPANPRLYVYYTDLSGSIAVGELTASGNTAPLSSLRNVITIPHPGQSNHNGGQLQFGPDGYLYLATGDGGGGGDPGENAQSLASLLGKLVRIDPRATGGQAYRVPADNPFVGSGARPEIWSYGLRNPYRFSFDRVGGGLTIGDVGQGAWEEVDFAPVSGGGGKGVNWGWDCREGAHDYEIAGCASQLFTDPVLEYANNSGTCAVTGGYVVRDPGLTELTGRYVYADFCQGALRSAVLATPAASDDRPEGLTVSSISSFGEDACGRIYTVSLGGAVSRIVDDTPTDCTVLLPGPPPTPDLPTVPGTGDPPTVDPPSPGPGPADPGTQPTRGKCGEIVQGDNAANRLRGGEGRQELIGLGGGDTLRGGEGRDCLRGGGGDDSLNGGAGRDELAGGTGDDRIRSRDGERDLVNCGPGDDVVNADREDRLRGC